MMFPKSVSGSTRIVALAAVMLIPAWGWAEELTSTTFEMTIWTDHSTGPIATCDLKYTNCVIIRPASFPCYEHMREAMKNVDSYINGVEGFLIYSDPTTGTVLDRNPKFRIDDGRLAQWQQTMADCVK